MTTKRCAVTPVRIVLAVSIAVIAACVWRVWPLVAWGW